MKVRHDNLLDMAHFLYTETEPRLVSEPNDCDASEAQDLADMVGSTTSLGRSVQKNRTGLKTRSRTLAKLSDAR